MPIADRSEARNPRFSRASAITSSVRRRISSGSCSTQPGFKKICSCSFCATATPCFMQKADHPHVGNAPLTLEKKTGRACATFRTGCASNRMKIGKRSYFDDEESKSKPSCPDNRDTRLGVWIFCSKCFRRGAGNRHHDGNCRRQKKHQPANRYKRQRAAFSEQGAHPGC